MKKSLMIVESGTKIKSLSGMVPKGIDITASNGHVRDLVAKAGSIDTEHGYAMKYQVIDKSAKRVQEIIKAAKSCDEILLATDPDREGEAIAWHLSHLIREGIGKKTIDIKRISFNQITKKAVLEALEQPRSLNEDLIDAQQARRALDYLVGFYLSPLLWRKISKGLSAGRVQTPALRLICEREKEIEAFKQQEYWTISAQLAINEALTLEAKLAEYQGERFDPMTVNTEEQATVICEAITVASPQTLEIAKVTPKKRRKNPPPPLITSTLQQEANNRFSFTASRTMRIAQQLYEGVEVNGNITGLITYMRTDSYHFADEAIAAIREHIGSAYGADAVPEKPVFYKQKSSNAQEAHEAIRPAQISLLPSAIKSALSDEQFKLYDLIWRRAVASQMKAAVYDQLALEIHAEQTAVFRSTLSKLEEPGFLEVLKDDISQDEPLLTDGQSFVAGSRVPYHEISKRQHFTEPPPRYSEASLIKTLESHGIGRPSTYATIISTLVNRKYADIIKKRFHPTDMGRLVVDFLAKFFERVVNYDFTAELEQLLDQVANGKQNWVALLEDFWPTFKKRIDEIMDTVKKSDVTNEVTEEPCPECGSHLIIRLGRYGKFYGCSNYPECKYTRPMSNDQAPPAAPQSTGVTCPQCNENDIVIRRSKRGKVFYGCSGFPKCKYVLWNKPLNEGCPQCQWPVLTEKVTKRDGTVWLCPQEDCDYKLKIEDAAE